MLGSQVAEDAAERFGHGRSLERAVVGFVGRNCLGRSRRGKRSSQTLGEGVSQMTFDSASTGEGVVHSEIEARAQTHGLVAAMGLVAMIEVWSRGRDLVRFEGSCGFAAAVVHAVVAVAVAVDVTVAATAAGGQNDPTQSPMADLGAVEVAMVGAVSRCTSRPSYSKTEARILEKLRDGTDRTSGSAPKTAPWFPPATV